MPEERVIKAVYQLCIRRRPDEKYNFVFLYEMSDGGLSYYEDALTFDEAQAYFIKKEWPLTLPEETGQTIQLVKNRRYIGQIKPIERSLPDEPNHQ